MDLEVLVATMNQKDTSIIEKMNLKSDAIICNQLSNFDYQLVTKGEHSIRFFSFNEKGVGLNRNNALLRSSSDICVLADDDMFFHEGYQEIIKKAYKENPDADVIIFNIDDSEGQRYVIKKRHRVNYFNYMRYGAARITFKSESIHKNSIYFNLLFGGGTKYSAGEDVLFLTECLKKGLKIYAVPYCYATLTYDRDSSWFNGYNEKFYRDRGALFAAISNRFAKILVAQYVLRKRTIIRKDFKLKDCYKLMCDGINEYRNL